MGGWMDRWMDGGLGSSPGLGAVSTDLPRCSIVLGSGKERHRPRYALYARGCAVRSGWGRAAVLPCCRAEPPLFAHLGTARVRAAAPWPCSAPVLSDGGRGGRQHRAPSEFELCSRRTVFLLSPAAGWAGSPRCLFVLI